MGQEQRSLGSLALRDSLLIVVHPRRTARELTGDPRALPASLLAWSVLGTAYTLTVAIGWANGFGAAVRPWVPIPAETYYVLRQIAVPIWMLGAGSIALSETHGIALWRAALALAVALAPGVLLAVTYIR